MAFVLDSPFNRTFAQMTVFMFAVDFTFHFSFQLLFQLHSTLLVHRQYFFHFYRLRGEVVFILFYFLAFDLRAIELHGNFMVDQ